METKCCRNRNPQTELEKLYFKILETYEGCVLVADKTGKIIFWSGPEPTETFGLTGEEMSSGITLQQMVNMAQQNISPSLNALYTGRVAREIVIPATGTVFQMTSTPVFGDKGELELVVTFAMFDEKQREATEYFAQERNRYMQILTELQGKKMSLSSSKQMVANDVKMQNVLKFADQIARKESCVLITGESGVGKDVIARYIHQHSQRSGHVFLPVNCAAIPENLAESELFGYESGSFTGAKKGGKPGLFELADGGTLFLDEIGELPLSIQAKLLRVLETSEVQRVGGSATEKVSVRILAATNMDLRMAVQNKTFRMDLYYRLNVFTLPIPPLRERPADIRPLIDSFLDEYNKKYRSKINFQPDELKQLQNYPFPGNIRELRNIVERYVITSGQFPQDLWENTGKVGENIGTAEQENIHWKETGLKRAIRLYEQQCIQQAMKQAKGVVPDAARLLQIPTSTLYQKLRMK